MNKILFIMLIIMVSLACGNRNKKYGPPNLPRDFDPTVLRDDIIPLKSVSGQVLYLPVYSNIPYQIDTGMFDMSAFVSIHNTDFNSKLLLSQVLYFNQDGKLVDDFLKDQQVYIEPLATKEFYIPYEDKSGTGANFLIEWIADTLITEPLIESITLSLKPNNTVAIKSQGRIISERK